VLMIGFGFGMARCKPTANFGQFVIFSCCFDGLNDSLPWSVRITGLWLDESSSVKLQS